MKVTSCSFPGEDASWATSFCHGCSYGMGIWESDARNPAFTFLLKLGCQGCWMMRDFFSSSCWFWDQVDGQLREGDSSDVLEIPSGPRNPKPRKVLGSECSCTIADSQALQWSPPWTAKVEGEHDGCWNLSFPLRLLFLLDKKNKENGSDHSKGFWKTKFLKEVPPLKESSRHIPNLYHHVSTDL